MVLTHDGQYLLAATGDSVTVVDVAALTHGNPHPPVFTIYGDNFEGAIYVNVTRDDDYLFVADEGAGAITVVNLKKTRASDFKTPVIVGSCNTGPPGEIEVIDVARAERDPARSVLSLVPGGCSPVRLILSADGATAYVTARGQDDVLAFDTARLVNDPAHALLGRVPAGAAPVGVALAAGRLIVASSNRFGGGRASQHLTTLSSDWRTWGHGTAVAAQINAGAFPREERLSPDGKTLYVTNFISQQLECPGIVGAMNSRTSAWHPFKNLSRLWRIAKAAGDRSRPASYCLMRASRTSAT